MNFKPNKLSFLIFVLGPILPFLMSLPTRRAKMQWRMQEAMGQIGDQLLERTRKEAATGEKAKDRSMIGTLSRSSSDNLIACTEPILVQFRPKPLMQVVLV